MKNDIDIEERIRLADDRRAFRDWCVSNRDCVTDESKLIGAMADVLSPLFMFLADGYRGGPSGNTLSLRAWIILYALRSDLIGNDTLKQAAERLGTTSSQLSRVLRILRERIPALNVDTIIRRNVNTDKQAKYDQIMGTVRRRVERQYQERARYRNWRGKRIENASSDIACDGARSQAVEVEHEAQ